MTALLCFLLAAAPATGVESALERYAQDRDRAALRTALQAATQTTPPKALAWYHLANLAIAEHRWGDAASAYRSFLALAPAGPLESIVRRELKALELAASRPNPQVQGALVYDLLIARAQESFRLGAFDVAAASAADAAQLVPGRYESYWLLGQVLSGAGVYAGAADLLGRALERLDDPIQRPAIEQVLLAARRNVRAEALARQAALAHGAGDVAGAAWLFADAFDAIPEQGEFALSAALELAAAGELDTAREYLDRASRTLPAPERWRAAEVRQRVPALSPLLDPAAEKLALLGDQAMDHGDFSAALAAFDKAVTAAPKAPGYVLRKAEAQAALGDSVGAATTLQGLSRQTPRTLAALGQAQQRAGQWAAALESADAALRVLPRSARLHRLKGLAERGLGLASSAAELRRAAELDPDDATNLKELSEAELATGEASKALAHAEEAVRLAPWSADVRLTLAAALFKSGRGDEGKRIAALAARLAAGAKVMRERLGGEP